MKSKILASYVLVQVFIRYLFSNQISYDFLLSDKIKPESYDILIHPDYFSGTQYEGEVKIVLNVVPDMHLISFHLDKTSIKILEALFTSEPANKKIKLKESDYDPNTKILTLSTIYGNPLNTSKICLILKFEGKIQNDRKGFYSYAQNHSQTLADHLLSLNYPFITKNILFTYFKPFFARKAFPCFDIPHFKATFNVSISVPKNLALALTVLSNMPVDRKLEIRFNGEDRLLYKFKETPLMSTHSLSWFIGITHSQEDKYMSTQGKQKTVTVYTLPGKVESVNFTQKVVISALEFLEEFCNEPYTLPKLDLLVIPELQPQSIGNWGLIAIREFSMLVHYQTDISICRSIAVQIAKEVLHMWVGNLVTLRGWDDLVYYEGFVSFITHEYITYALDNALFQQDFINSVVRNVYEVDSSSKGITIDTEISNLKTIEEDIDHFQVSKVATVMKVVSDWIGFQKLQEGIQIYIRSYKYKSVKFLSFLQILDIINKKPISAMFNSYVTQSGIPLISVTIEQMTGYKYTLEVHQKEFINSWKQTEKIWEFPIFFEIHFIDQYNQKKVRSEMIYIRERKHTYILELGHNEHLRAIIVSERGKGYYIAQYSWKMLDSILNLCSEEDISEITLSKLFLDAVKIMQYRKLSPIHVLRFINTCLMGSVTPWTFLELKKFASFWREFDDILPDTYLLNYLYNNLESNEVIKELKKTQRYDNTSPSLDTYKRNPLDIFKPELECLQLFEYYIFDLFSYILRNNKGTDELTCRAKKDKETIDNFFKEVDNLPAYMYPLISSDDVDKNYESYIKYFADIDNKEFQKAILNTFYLINFEKDGIPDKEKLRKLFSFIDSEQLTLQEKCDIYYYLIVANPNRKLVVEYLVENSQHFKENYSGTKLIKYVIKAFSSFQDVSCLEVLDKLVKEEDRVENEYEETRQKIKDNSLFANFYQKTSSQEFLAEELLEYRKAK